MENDTAPRFTLNTIPRRRARPSLEPIITRLKYTLAPLHPLPYGVAHPAFPATLLKYHLLTEQQLDSIAQYYHQWTFSPSVWANGYPTNAHWNHEFLQHLGSGHGDEHRCGVKRRKIGRFIGLRGCETPLEESDEFERWMARREKMFVKSAGDFAFHGRRGFGSW